MRFVYAIAFIGDEFVMVKHRHRAWEMPGGRVDEGEEDGDAIIREFREETGMNFIPVSRESVEGGAVFFGTADGECRQTSAEISEVGLFEELPGELSFPLVEYESMIKLAREMLKKYINRETIGDSSPT